MTVLRLQYDPYWNITFIFGSLQAQRSEPEFISVPLTLRLKPSWGGNLIPEDKNSVPETLHLEIFKTTRRVQSNTKFTPTHRRP
jgi:hypothetical protein